MKVQIAKKDLVSLLARTQNIVEKRNTMPVLVNVLLQAENNELKVFATDLEVSLTDVAIAKISVDGKVAVNTKNLFDIVKELNDGDIELHKQTNNWLKISQNKSVFNIVGISPDEYPVFPAYTTNDFMKIESNVFSDMIEKTIYSVSHDETRYHLNGVYFGKSNNTEDSTLRMVATDGHRLSLVDRAAENVSNITSKGVIIPRKGLNEIRKILDSIDGKFEMAIEGAQLIVRHKKTLLMVRLIEGKYPNYQQLIPQKLKHKLLLNKDSFVSSLKRVSLLSNQKSKGVTLNLKNGSIQISSNNPELGDAKEELEVDYKGSEFKIGFNAKYLLEILATIQDDVIDVEVNDQLSPGLLRPNNDTSYTCVVMPMRI